MLPPLDKGNVVSTSGKFARRCRGDARITAAAQLENPVGLLRACQYDSVFNRTPSEFDHRVDNSID
jgi:hypothetical protein